MRRYYSLCCVALAISLVAICSISAIAKENKPEELKKVTLECDEGWQLKVTPFFSVGADVINQSVHGKTKARTKSLTIEYLPDALLLVGLERVKGKPNEPNNEEFILPLLDSDSGKVLHLRLDGSCLYANDTCVCIGFRKNTDIPAWIKKHGDDIKKSDLRFVFVETTDKYLPLLQWLKESGVGVGIINAGEKQPPDKKKKVVPCSTAFAQALVAVQPKYFAAVSDQEIGKLNIPFGDLKNLVSLMVFSMNSNDIVAKPNVEKRSDPSVAIASTKLRHLCLLGFVVPKKELPKLANLKSFNACLVPDNNMNLFDKIPQLQMLLVAPTGYHLTPSVLEKLPNLQYLAASFPPDTDFSFVGKMPYLQTLAITNMTEKHNLTPLAKYPQLKYLALKGPDFKKMMEFETVKKFQKERPDVEVVEAEGLCLGSFWILPMVVLVGMGVWLVRRRRGVFHGPY